MTTSPFKPAKTRTAKRKPGGDDSVERDHQGRPRIWVRCECDSGKVPSTKRPGNTVQCTKCKGDGYLIRSYTRTTTYIDVLADKSSLEAWLQRKVLQGVAVEPSLLEGVMGRDDSEQEDRDWLNRRAERAKEVGGANEKSDHGTLLHDYSEVVDKGEELSDDVHPIDWLDIEAYRAVTQPLLRIVHMEKLRVNDDLKIAGTPDRVSSPREGVKLVAPDGYELDPEELYITDLKTGRVDLPDVRLKMAMQLSIYAHSLLYIPESVERGPQEPINQKWGIIMHSAAGAGQTDLYWADLQAGWEAVQVATQVREQRRKARHALVPFAA